MKKKVNENLISLEIIKDLDKFNLYFTKKYSKINLVSIFFLEIQKYLSCAIKNIHFKTYSKNQQIILPFFDYNYLIKSQKLIYKKGNWTDYKINLFKSFIIYKISNIVNSIKKTEFGIFQLNKSKLITNKFDKLNINKIYFSKIYLENIDLQKNELKNFLDNFKKELKIKNKYFSSNFITFLKYFLSDKITDNKVFTDKLLVGTNMNIFNRVMSAKYLLNKKKVISFQHANYSSLIYDDPMNECGEFCFSTNYIVNTNIKYKKKYIISDLLAPKLIKTYVDKKIKRIENQITLNKFLYVPNSYNSFRRYGYYRDIDDKIYIDWQKKIIKSNDNIFFKKHIKSRFDYNIFSKKIYINGLMEEQLDKFDLFIFDVISQPFFSIAKTDKKILYLDINQRIIDKKAYKLIKNRAYVFKCNYLTTTPNEINRAISMALKFKIKNFHILKYC